MGMSDEEFMEFRRRCNKVSFNLRKNQYAKMLAIQKTRLEDIINDIKGAEDSDARGQLKWKDKYGWEAKKEQDALIDRSDGRKWDINKSKTSRNVSVFAKAEQILADDERTVFQYKQDLGRLEERTFQYLKDVGVVNDESDLERLVVESKAVNSENRGDVLAWIS